jgi:hypothetical protein
MKNIKIVLPLAVSLIAISVSYFYTENRIEDKIKLSMEEHNKTAAVIFNGDPNINLVSGTFEINNLEISNNINKEVVNGNLKVSGISYINYFTGKQVLTNNMTINLNDLKVAEDIYSDNEVSVINKDNLVINTTTNYFDKDKENNLKQILNVELKNSNVFYESLLSNLNEVIINNKPLDSKKLSNDFKQLVEVISIEKVKYKAENEGLLIDLLFKRMNEVYDFKDKEELKLTLLDDVNKIPYLNQEIKNKLKLFLTEQDKVIEVEALNKKSTMLKDLISKIFISGNPQKAIEENYEIKVQ